MGYTKGEWFANNYAGHINIENEPFYGSLNLLDQEVCEEAEANAKLICAAPELLEALQLIKERLAFKDLNFFHKGKHIERIVNEAIKKATE